MDIGLDSTDSDNRGLLLELDTCFPFRRAELPVDFFFLASRRLARTLRACLNRHETHQEVRPGKTLIDEEMSGFRPAHAGLRNADLR